MLNTGLSKYVEVEQKTLLQTVALYIWGAPKKVNIFIHIIYNIYYKYNIYDII